MLNEQLPPCHIDIDCVWDFTTFVETCNFCFIQQHQLTLYLYAYVKFVHGLPQPCQPCLYVGLCREKQYQ